MVCICHPECAILHAAALGGQSPLEALPLPADAGAVGSKEPQDLVDQAHGLCYDTLPRLLPMSLKFKIVSEFEPRGGQRKAIAELTAGAAAKSRHQVLLGITGSGKTFTIANLIEKMQRPTLIIAHNKTLAAQLYGEFKDI